MSHNNPTVLTLTGPSCSGKSTLARALVETGQFREVISTTTRAPRPGEVNGVHYHFVTEDEFDAISQGGGFVESVRFSGACYGASTAEFNRCHAQGKHAVIVCDQHGAEEINHYANNHGWKLVSGFLDVPPHIAVERFCQRFASEADKVTALPSYAKRLTKVVTDERDWRNQFDFDIYLPMSLTPEDTTRQIALLNQEMAQASAPEWKNLRKVIDYPEELIERTLQKITAVLKGQDTEKAVEQIVGLGR